MTFARKEIAPLLRAVHDNLDQPQRLARLARQSGYSPFHFHRRFLSVVGETPMRHVSCVRLERAAYLLAIVDEPVVAIALQAASHRGLLPGGSPAAAGKNRQAKVIARLYGLGHEHA